MTTVPEDVDVVVVGGGLAGLAAARRLHRSGRSWVLVEAADRLGGRVATDTVDGYRLDRGFQVLNTAYPRLAALVDLDALRLRHFTAGVLVRRGAHLHRFAHPRFDPVRAPASLRSDVGTLADRLKLGALLARYGVTTPAGALAEPELTTEELLRRNGLSGRIVEELVRPFLSGVFADPELSTSSHVFAMVVRAFVRGRIGVPDGGMGELPAAVARPLPADRIVLNTPVVSVAPGRVETEGGAIGCRAIIVATDPPTAARLLPGIGTPRMRGLTTYYHGTAHPPLPEPVLLLDGDRRELVANTVVLSLAAPRYAPVGRHLIATSVVGEPVPEPMVRSELERLYGAPTAEWEEIAVVHVPNALPDAPPPQGRLRKPVALGEGLFVAGDHRDSPSIQGALASGWRTAEAALR